MQRLSPAASPIVGSPVTVQFNQFQLGSNDLPLTDSLLAPAAGPDHPDQIHITLGSGKLPLCMDGRPILPDLAATLCPGAPLNSF